MKIKMIVPMTLFLCILYIFMQAYQMVIPISLVNVSATYKKLKIIGVHNKDIANIIDFAAKKYNHSPELIIALVKTESNFDEKALSSMGYKGLMQISQNVPSDANILIGSRILREKLEITNGDIKKALCLYKGYSIGTKKGSQEADKVINLCKTIKLQT